MDALRAEATTKFQTLFGAPATHLGIAPGRAEIVGNHTDYNEGYILSCAVDRYICIAGRAVAGTGAKVQSSSFDGIVEFNTASVDKQEGEQSWANYVLGVVSELNKIEGIAVQGFECFVTSDVPPGSGVSSSAALEMATAKLLQGLYPSTIGALDDMTIIKTCKAAENNFVGMGCGILDQFSSGMGKSGELIFLDCRTLEHQYAQFGKGACFVLANTKAKHALVDGQYDELRRACFASAAAFQGLLSGKKVTHLRDVEVAEFEEHKDKLSHDDARRAKHIVYDNQRTLDSFEAMKKGEIEKLGEAMTASHNSSRDDFGNSCEELDLMRKLAEDIPGFLGGRLMGGGFGGCTINLVRENEVDAFCAELTKRYLDATVGKGTDGRGIEADMIKIVPGEGAAVQVVQYMQPGSTVVAPQTVVYQSAPHSAPTPAANVISTKITWNGQEYPSMEAVTLAMQAGSLSTPIAKELPVKEPVKEEKNEEEVVKTVREGKPRKVGCC